MSEATGGTVGAGAPSQRTLSVRQREALPGSGYDRLIGMLKIVLPAVSGVLLLLLLVLPLLASDETSFLLSKDRVKTSEDRLRVEAAVYRGEDKRGRDFTVRADQAVQRTAADPTVQLQQIRAEMALEDGPAVATAPAGRYDLEKGQLVVRSPVEFRSEGGYRLTSGTVIIDLVDRTLRSDSPVTGAMPLGSFRARRIRADVSGRNLVLEGDARLRITQRTRR
jgi:lipopolysaccharide export system protein LptC